MFSFQQGLSGQTIRLIADSCQNLKKFNLGGVVQIDDDDLIHVIDRLGEQLTTLVWMDIMSGMMHIHILVIVPGNVML